MWDLNRPWKNQHRNQVVDLSYKNRNPVLLKHYFYHFYWFTGLYNMSYSDLFNPFSIKKIPVIRNQFKTIGMIVSFACGPVQRMIIAQFWTFYGQARALSLVPMGLFDSTCSRTGCAEFEQACTTVFASLILGYKSEWRLYNDKAH